jgi:hypothetical protein
MEKVVAGIAVMLSVMVVCVHLLINSKFGQSVGFSFVGIKPLDICPIRKCRLLNVIIYR